MKGDLFLKKYTGFYTHHSMEFQTNHWYLYFEVYVLKYVKNRSEYTQSIGTTELRLLSLF